MAQEDMKKDETIDVESTETVDEVIEEEVIDEVAEEEDDPKKAKKKAKAEKSKDKEKIAELEDKVMRQMAEFENFRKRTEKEKSGMYDAGSRSVIEKILPIVDNFERGFAGMTEEQLAEPFAAGMVMVYKQFIAELEKMDVKAIPAVGEQFDPNLHNAVMHIDDDKYGENEIVAEFQKGYTHHDVVVRHSMVQVAN